MRVTLFHLAVPKHPLAAASALLSDDEVKRAYRFKTEALRSRFLWRRSLLRFALDRPFLKLTHNANGKPALQEADGPAFNVSSTGTRDDPGLAVVAVADRPDPVGVDVERQRPLQRNDLKLPVFSPAEVRDLAEAEAKLTRFYELWTLKEAYLKARGFGLSAPASKLSFAGTDAERVELAACSEEREPQRWRFWRGLLSPNDDLPVSVAVAARAEDLEVHLRYVAPDELRAFADRLLGEERAPKGS